MKEKFLDFLKAPDAKNYLAVRTALIESDDYDPYSSELVDCETLLTDEKFEEAGVLLSSAMANLILSPRAHLIMAFIAGKLENEETQYRIKSGNIIDT